HPRERTRNPNLRPDDAIGGLADQLMPERAVKPRVQQATAAGIDEDERLRGQISLFEPLAEVARGDGLVVGEHEHGSRRSPIGALLAAAMTAEVDDLISELRRLQCLAQLTA